VRLLRSRWLRLAASIGFIALGIDIVFRLPRLSGSTWTDMEHRIGQIGTGTVLAIGALWIGGLVTYTFAMTSSMPGLTHRRALALNLAGSSAANALPFGGVVGTGLNLAMIRSWRLSTRSFASSTAVLNVVNLITKLTLPVIAGVVIGRNQNVAPWLGKSAIAASLTSAAVVALLVWALTSGAWARKIDELWLRVMRRVRPAADAEVDAPADLDPATALELPLGPVSLLREQVREVFRRKWFGLAAGMSGYVLLQWALFALCLHAAGVHASTGAVFAAFAVERALTLAVFTPSGTGLAEAAATGILVATGSWPASAAAGVLLYRLFVFLAEIPVGVVVLGAWASLRLARRERVPAPV
jgi:putative heme transporter